MPWSANVVLSAPRPSDPGVADVAVTFTNGDVVHTIGTGVRSQAELDAWILNQTRQYAAVEDLVASLTPGLALNTTPPKPQDPPVDPNAGLAELTIAGFLSLLSSESVGKLRDRMAGAIDPLRRDIVNQDRPAVMHWIALSAAGTDPIITPEEAAALVGYLQTKAP